MTKYRLLCGTAIVAATAMAGSQAKAFDQVNWTWTLTANTTIDQTITTNTEINPSGLTAIEDVQIFIGDLEATSFVSGVQNQQPETEGGTIQVPLTLTLSGDASATGDTDLTSFANAAVTDEDDNELASVSDTIDNSGIDPTGNFDGTADFVVEVDIPGEAQGFDATVELPEVVSTALAVGNNANIVSDVKTDVHDTQILFNADDDSSGFYEIAALTETTTTVSSLSSATANMDSSSFSSSFSTTTDTTETSESSETLSFSEDLNESFDLTVGGSLDVDKTYTTTATASLTENLNVSASESASGTFFVDSFFEGDFTATATGSNSASGSMSENIDVGHDDELIDFAVDIEASKSLDYTADASGFFDGTATVDGSTTYDASGDLALNKTVDVDASESVAKNLSVSGTYNADGTWNFSESGSSASASTFSTATSTASASEAASESMSSFSTSLDTETTSVATLDSKSVTTEGDLYALDTAFGLWGDLLDQGVNTGLATTLSLMVAAAYGGLEQANISADSQVFDILNASVDSSATAVGNNKSITVDAATAGDAMLVGDVNQFAYANISAYSEVGGVTVENYLNLGQIDRPLVNSNATAIGNNLSVTVNSALAPQSE